MSSLRGSPRSKIGTLAWQTDQAMTNLVKRACLRMPLKRVCRRIRSFPHGRQAAQSLNICSAFFSQDSVARTTRTKHAEEDSIHL
mmetsp:Transcript_102446/g.181957  ORF Transcript_102446/g.181957 Transcript_102446/m.181957 type:complete len:85 (-) Transcript_102446:235-489(-)